VTKATPKTFTAALSMRKALKGIFASYAKSPLSSPLIYTWSPFINPNRGDTIGSFDRPRSSNTSASLISPILSSSTCALLNCPVGVSFSILQGLLPSDTESRLYQSFFLLRSKNAKSKESNLTLGQLVRDLQPQVEIVGNRCRYCKETSLSGQSSSRIAIPPDFRPLRREKTTYNFRPCLFEHWRARAKSQQTVDNNR